MPKDPSEVAQERQDFQEQQRRSQEPPPPRADDDQHGEEAQDGGVELIGRTSDQPEGDTRTDRQETQGLTPAEHREAVVKRIREKREREREEAIEAREAATVEAEATSGQEQEQQQEQRQEPPPAGEERTYKIRFNHGDRMMSEAELIQAAQRGLYAENAMAEIRSTLAELRQERNNPNRQPESAHQAEPSADRAGQDSRDARTKGKTDLRQLAEGIQAGDADDAVEALDSFRQAIVEEIRAEQPGASPDDVADRVEQRLQARTAQKSFTDYFAKKHPELAGRRGLQLELIDRMHQEHIKELRSIVRESDGHMLSDAELAPALADPKTALEWVGTYSNSGVKRADGKPIANPVQVMDRAAELLKDELGIRRQAAPQQRTTPAATDPNRQSRVVAEKRTLSEPRTAQTATRPGSGAPQSRKTPEQRRASAIGQRRQALGLDPLP